MYEVYVVHSGKRALIGRRYNRYDARNLATVAAQRRELDGLCIISPHGYDENYTREQALAIDNRLTTRG